MKQIKDLHAHYNILLCHKNVLERALKLLGKSNLSFDRLKYFKFGQFTIERTRKMMQNFEKTLFFYKKREVVDLIH